MSFCFKRQSWVESLVEIKKKTLYVPQLKFRALVGLRL